MQKLRNKKRLTVLALAFMLTFVVGAAFAFADGVLDIRGTVSVTAIDELYVTWYSVDYGEGEITINDTAVSAGVTIGAGASATFADSSRLNDGRTNQRIVWSIDFCLEDFLDPLGAAGFSMASLTATAMNHATMPAEIALVEFSGRDYDWRMLDGDGEEVSAVALAAELGLTVTVNSDNFEGVLGVAPTNRSDALQVIVNWDPLPIEPGTALYEAEPGDVFTLFLVIEFDYFPVP
jgi:hypothetical protein